MTQAILAFYSQNLWSKQYPRQTQRTLHWILQIVGSSAAIIGMIIEFIGRSQKGKSHFKSIHSLFGLTAGILAVISMLGGVSALWSFEIRKYVRPIYFKLAHNLNGITAFVLGKSSHQSKKIVSARNWLRFAVFLCCSLHHRHGLAIFGLRQELYDKELA